MNIAKALSLFEEITNKPIFEKTPIILFLNKKDIFEKMIKQTPLTKCFPHYKGGKLISIWIYVELVFPEEGDMKACLHFISEEFR
jgi:hypothetical protein